MTSQPPITDDLAELETYLLDCEPGDLVAAIRDWCEEWILAETGLEVPEVKWQDPAPEPEPQGRLR